MKYRSYPGPASADRTRNISGLSAAPESARKGSMTLEEPFRLWTVFSSVPVAEEAKRSSQTVAYLRQTSRRLSHSVLHRRRRVHVLHVRPADEAVHWAAALKIVVRINDKQLHVFPRRAFADGEGKARSVDLHRSRMLKIFSCTLRLPARKKTAVECAPGHPSIGRSGPRARRQGRHNFQ